jgi:PA14 domain/PEP-CTERM motif
MLIQTVTPFGVHVSALIKEAPMKLIHALALSAGLLLPLSQASAYTVSIWDRSPMTSLAQADAAIASGPATLSSYASVIEFDDFGDGSRGLFSVNNPFGITPPDTFAAKVTGYFNIATAGTYTFGINHDDGARLVIDGLAALTAAADGVTDNRTTTVTGFMSAGLHAVEIVYFENGGGASLEFFGKSGSASSTAPWALVSSAAVPAPGTLALAGLSLLSLGLVRRRRA